jgi:hypothetical protein
LDRKRPFPRSLSDVRRWNASGRRERDDVTGLAASGKTAGQGGSNDLARADGATGLFRVHRRKNESRAIGKKFNK